MILAIPAINLIAELNAQMSLPESLSSLEEWIRAAENDAQRLSVAFLNVTSISGLVLNVLMIAVIPGIGEELLFRGVFQRLFIEWSKSVHVGIFISAFLFSAMHMQFFGFLPRFLMGLFFGYLAFWSGSLWMPILAHFVNNFIAVLFSYMASKSILDRHFESIGNSPETLIYALLSVVVTTLLIYLIYKKERRLLNRV
jgi:uncharacterized protein